MGLEHDVDYRQLLYKLLYYSLIEIRSSTEEESPSKKIYAISSLVHNLPMVLMREGNSPTANYKAAYSDILARADTLGIGGWLRSVSKQKK